MRYIDADALIKKIYPMGIGDGKYTINAKAVKLAIDNAPTADVVPKSEVDKLLISKTTEIHIAMEKLVDVRVEHPIFNAIKAEVAREIFEEIYETMNSVYASVQRSCVGMHGDNPETMRLIGKLEGVTHLGDEIAELKKKYTENENG